ncbi:epoxyqueuosine reductase QueH [Helicobacter sp. MIT 14-3879]|uniref:epoxyqueuosine reductase QueH n=1 Tax=Helicobacter sp. MIT 14-3879 TaxID=2040649 RepID=UPI000E1F5B45|nr:epoxyqueuosine reductase QueH [Helicobacter sp. MIT 14-3879]RDU65243.1 hypothetical protein CQA44_01725 [Helicobacter sp. MIT 14-3879]
MLVHICCSVDSHYFLQELHQLYPNENLIGFFYNPNIHPEEEYNLRLLDVKRSCEKLQIPLLVGDYNFISWLDEVVGLEDEEEKGDRCSVCFDVRLLKTAMLALEIGENKISTTLLTSPMKSQNELFALGEKIANKYSLEFIKLDTRSNGGTQKQSKMVKDSNLYRQNYCGCQFALKKQRERKNAITLELFSEIGNRALYGSPKYTIDIFLQLWELEKNKKEFILQKNSITTYRNLNSKISHNNAIIPSYIFTHSKAVKKLKIKEIKWHKVSYDNTKILIGFNDNANFIDIESINKIFLTNYQNTTQMLYNPPKYDDELNFRMKILGKESIKPFIVLNEKIENNVLLNIDSVFQNIDIFELIKL